MGAVLTIVFTIGFFFAINRVYRKNWDRSFEVKMSFSVKSVNINEYVDVVIEINNKKRLVLPWIAVNYRLSGSLQKEKEKGKAISIRDNRSSVFALRGKQGLRKTSRYLCTKRGYYRLEDIHVDCKDIFFTTVGQKRCPSPKGLVVHPKIIDYASIDVPELKDFGESLVNRLYDPDPFEFSYIREYQPQDNRRHINFRAWAKTGMPMSNVHNYSVSQNAVIILDLLPRENTIRGTTLQEYIISLAASLSWRFLENKIPVAIFCGGKDAITKDYSALSIGATENHFIRILDVLGRIDLSQEPVSINEFVSTEDVGKYTMVLLLSCRINSSELLEFINKLEGRKIRSIWIIPKSHDEEISGISDSMIVWEYKDG